MHRFFAICAALAWLTPGHAIGAAEAVPGPAGPLVTRLDPAIDRIIPAAARLSLVGDRFGLVKGLQWVNDGHGGYLVVGDLISNVLYKIGRDGTISVFMEQAGFSGGDASQAGAQTMRGRSFVLLVGPTCVGMTAQGRLVWCATNDRAVMRLEPDGSRAVLASSASGKRFSGPNSIAFRRDGGLYLADNDFGLRDTGKSPLKEMPNAVWLLREGRQPIRVIGIEELGGIPDGIALSPDEHWLYLSAGNLLKRYPVLADGRIGPGKTVSQGDGIGDGIAVDAEGNLYSTGGFGAGCVRVMAADGKLLGFINLPVPGGEPKRRICSDNAAFGGSDGRTLFIAACEAVYAVRLSVGGAKPAAMVALPVPKTP